MEITNYFGTDVTVDVIFSQPTLNNCNKIGETISYQQPRNILYVAYPDCGTVVTITATIVPRGNCNPLGSPYGSPLEMKRDPEDGYTFPNVAIAKVCKTGDCILLAV